MKIKRTAKEEKERKNKNNGMKQKPNRTKQKIVK